MNDEERDMLKDPADLLGKGWKDITQDYPQAPLTEKNKGNWI